MLKLSVIALILINTTLVLLHGYLFLLDGKSAFTPFVNWFLIISSIYGAALLFKRPKMGLVVIIVSALLYISSFVFAALFNINCIDCFDPARKDLVDSRPLPTREVTVKPRLSNPHPPQYATYEPPPFPGTAINSVQIDSQKCVIKITKDVGEVAISLNSSGMRNPRCIKNPRYFISPSSQYLAYEDVSGGVDSVVKVFTGQYDISVNLDYFGTTTISDMEFLSGNYLAVLSGQNLIIYNIERLFMSYPDNFDPRYNAFNDTLYDNKKYYPIEGANRASLETELNRYPLGQLTDFTFKISQPNALLFVTKLPEVSDFANQTSTRHRIEYSHEDTLKNSWVIHVYESLSDHNATFNWYYVNKTSGEVTKEFNP